MRGYLLFEITGYPLIIFMSEILNGMVFYVEEIYHVMIILLLRAYIRSPFQTSCRQPPIRHPGLFPLLG